MEGLKRTPIRWPGYEFIRDMTAYEVQRLRMLEGEHLSENEVREIGKWEAWATRQRLRIEYGA